jgi:hypothetical protein
MNRFVCVFILTALAMTAAIPDCEAADLFILGAGYSSYQESTALVWDPSYYMTGSYFFDVGAGLQLGLSASYHFLQPRPASDLFGIGGYWDAPEGDGWMFSLMPAVRVPFPIGYDGSTLVYLQGGVGWYHLDLDVVYTGTAGIGGEDIENEVVAKWDRPGIDGRFGVLTRLNGSLFLEISPGISVIFTGGESTWSFNGYVAVDLSM